ncbi:MAG: hypothetical protein H6705_20980 [Myxococcales bacterium]|nr:hypothetical protein [Myxococcales bacterium]
MPAEAVGRVWGEFVDAVGGRIRSRLGDGIEAETLTLPRPTAGDWKWLVPSNVAGFIERDPSARTLARELRSAAESTRLVVPHRLETLLLRHCAAATDADLRMILGLRARPGDMAEALQHLRAVRPAPARKPWLDGYEMALAVRSALGWHDEPAPADLSAWCACNSIDLIDREGSSQIDAVVVSCVGHRPLIDLNPNGGAIRRWSPRFMTAAGLGMLLLDASPDHDFGFVFGPREDWPSAARARAFAAMLLMPVDGVRQSLDAFGRKSMNALMDGVRAIMSRFGTSALATTYHLKNLGFISDEERVDVVTALAAG